MNYLKTFSILSLFTSFATLVYAKNPLDLSQSKKSVFDYTVNDIKGNPVKLSKYKGKKLLIVNAASNCGYTPQYKYLQDLHVKYGEKLAILAFPSNSFFQERGTNEEIQSFCTKKFGVGFDLFEKIDVKGKNQHPLYNFLSNKELNGWNNDAPSWNFCKYLLDEKGNLLKFFKSGVSPTSEEITSLL
jgi:glutathione peroxidase